MKLEERIDDMKARRARRGAEASVSPEQTITPQIAHIAAHGNQGKGQWGGREPGLPRAQAHGQANVHLRARRWGGFRAGEALGVPDESRIWLAFAVFLRRRETLGKLGHRRHHAGVLLILLAEPLFHAERRHLGLVRQQRQVDVLERRAQRLGRRAGEDAHVQRAVHVGGRDGLLLVQPQQQDAPASDGRVQVGLHVDTHASAAVGARLLVKLLALARRFLIGARRHVALGAQRRQQPDGPLPKQKRVDQLRVLAQRLLGIENGEAKRSPEVLENVLEARVHPARSAPA
eukprot:6184662-Pleurochrysis_carterae.AAC.2